MAEFEPKLMQKKSFIRSKENILASYDYSDVVNGLGFFDFWAYQAETTGDVDAFKLSPSIWESRKDGSTATSTTLQSGWSAAPPSFPVRTLDFNSDTFKTPRTLTGNLHLTGRYSWGQGVAGRSMTIKFELIKYDGSETLIGTYTTESKTSSINDYDYHFFIPLTETSIGVGDYLIFRVTYTLTGSDSNIISSVLTIATDPEADSWYNHLRIPVKIEQ